MNAFPPPRDFQTQALQRLREEMLQGKSRLILSAPTGSGKTYLGLLLAKLAMDKGRRAIFVCDRIELIDQTVNTAVNYGLRDIGVIQGAHPLRRNHARLLIASSQTLARRQWPVDIDLTIIDEAHTIYESWSRRLRENPRAKTIGLTATPFTKGLGRLFDGLVNAAVMDRLVAEGVLVQPKFFGHKRFDLAGAAIKGGEYDSDDLTQRGTPLIGDIVQAWKDRAQKRKTICFVPSVEFGEFLATQFGRENVVARVVSYKTPSSVRATYINEFRLEKSPIDILISVDALAKGFDVPDVGCVIDARPLRKSLSAYVQMIGRGLRSHPGKKECIVIDHSGNIDRFGKEFEALYYDGVQSLDDGEKKDTKPRKSKDEGGDQEAGKCPQCGYQPFASVCISCGYTKTRKTTKQAIVAGKLVEVPLALSRNTANVPKLFLEIASYLQTSTTPPEKRAARLKILYEAISGYRAPTEWFKVPLEVVQPSAATVHKIKKKTYAYLRNIGVMKSTWSKRS